MSRNHLWTPDVIAQTVARVRAFLEEHTPPGD